MGTNVSRNDSVAKITFVSICCFLSGTVYTYVINVIGEVYAPELLLIPVAVAVLIFGRTQRVLSRRFFLALLVSSVIMLLGYIVSDLYRESDPAQYLRGWGRIGLLISDITVFAILSANNKRNIWWYVSGISIGSITSLLVKGAPLSSNWKFGYGDPIIFLTACFAIILPMRFISLALLAVGLLSVGLDSRIQGALCILTSVFLWTRSGRPQQALMRLWQFWKIILVGVIAFSALAGVYISTQQEYVVHRQQSNIGRMTMLRIGLVAIAESPIIGYGSWSEDPKFAQMTAVELAKTEGKSQLVVTQSDKFGPHSQILQAWVEGGILAIAFFFIFGYQSFQTLKYVALQRPVDPYTPIFVYVLSMGLWDLLMSPFAGYHRLTIALSIAIISAIVVERHASNLKTQSKTLGVPLGRSARDVTS